MDGAVLSNALSFVATVAIGIFHAWHFAQKARVVWSSYRFKGAIDFAAKGRRCRGKEGEQHDMHGASAALLTSRRQGTHMFSSLWEDSSAALAACISCCSPSLPRLRRPLAAKSIAPLNLYELQTTRVFCAKCQAWKFPIATVATKLKAFRLIKWLHPSYPPLCRATPAVTWPLLFCCESANEHEPWSWRVIFPTSHFILQGVKQQALDLVRDLLCQCATSFVIRYFYKFISRRLKYTSDKKVSRRTDIFMSTLIQSE